ncbi:Uncharacterised protein [BD1-7 clade bacterium]|uniref:Uncharacterized protein n=1 Tax=BD1-7 clade bacterium TaxID=2029982 RepID=A0A5S9NSB0_9GAMM|nr:Uncharacterised protein [BD1-7 clade bacterium]CAA0093499.1 Uncharacterised protein [BD1-7 clade bacterium]
MSAPSSYSNITPMTTMVQNYVSEGMPLAEAEAITQERFKTSASPSIDYMETMTTADINSNQFREAMYLQRVANITSAMMGTNAKIINDMDSEDEITPKASLSVNIIQHDG